jgi:hypothetical protein
LGWSFRRTINLGPLRVNLSKSGVGYSVGTRGFRVGQDAHGRRYRAVSIPKTGIYRRDYQPKAPPATPGAGPAVGRPQWPLYIGAAVLLYILLKVVF